MYLTRPQRVALAKLYRRYYGDTPRSAFHGLSLVSYCAFRRSVLPGPKCIMVRWNGMWIGIEPDGYAHS